MPSFAPDPFTYLRQRAIRGGGSGGAVVVPTLTLSGPLTYAVGDPSGTLVANIGNVLAGVTPTLTPNDGRLVIAGDQASGWRVVKGMTASVAGNLAFTVAATGAQSVSGTVVVTASASTARTYDFSAASYPTPDPFASDIAFSRASPGWALDKNNDWQAFAAGVPRRTDRGLLLETAAATNPVPNNTFTGQALNAAPVGWTFTALNGLTFTVIAVGSRNGVPYARVRMAGTPVANFQTTVAKMVPNATGGASPGQSIASSLYFKHVAGAVPTGAVLRLGANTNTGSGIANGYSILTPTKYDLDWDRRAFANIAPATTTSVQGMILFTNSNLNPIDWTFEIGGLQFDVGASGPSSLILTSGAAVTRAADSCTLAGAALSTVQGASGAIEITHEAQNHLQVASRVVLGVNGTPALAQGADFGITTAFGGAQATQSGRKSNWCAPNKSRLTWDAANVAISSSVNMATAASSATPPAVASVEVGGSGATGFGGYVSQVTLRSERVTDLSDAKTVDADVIIYDPTPGAITAAVNARRMGRSVAIIGGWRARHLGGMMSGGLGATDIENPTTAEAAFGGLARQTIYRIAARNGNFGGFYVVPRYAEAEFDEMILNAGVSVYYSTGVVSAEKVSGKVRSLTTMDGKRAQGRFFIDGSYEGDLLAASGVTTTFGREAPDPNNPLNGVRTGAGITFAGLTNNIDPYVVPGDPGSGLLPGVVAKPADLIVGSADSRLQAFNFRMTVTNEAARRVANSWNPGGAPPPGYNAANYEIQGRVLATVTAAGKVYGTHYSLAGGIFVLSALGGGVNDLNSASGFSTDFVGANWQGVNYATATYAQREVIWKAHEAYIRGLFYWYAHSGDPRIPAQLATDMASYGLSNDHYLDPHPNDQPYWPYAFYVRSARRMVGDYIVSSADLGATDGTAPRSAKIIAAGDYVRDSHHVIRYNENGVIRSEGNFQAPSGGTDMRFPIPLEAALPKRADATNIVPTFCLSATHESHSALRMEPVHLAVGAALGAAAALCVKNSSDIQDVDYAALSGFLAEQGQVMPLTN